MPEDILGAGTAGCGGCTALATASCVESSAEGCCCAAAGSTPSLLPSWPGLGRGEAAAASAPETASSAALSSWSSCCEVEVESRRDSESAGGVSSDSGSATCSKRWLGGLGRAWGPR